MSAVSSLARTSDGSGRAWSPSMNNDDAQDDQISHPQLLCACKIPTCQKTSHTERNPDREYYACRKVGTNSRFACKTWIWVDLVSDYVDQMIKYRARDSLAKLEEEFSAVKQELEAKNELISSSARDRVEQGRAHQIEITELKCKIVALQSSAQKAKKIRMFMVLYVVMCWTIAPGPLVVSLIASMILARMYLS